MKWVARGTGTPKDKDEVNRREVWECDGWECDLEVMGDPSISRIIRKSFNLRKSQSNPGLELGRTSRTEELEESTVVLRNLNSWNHQRSLDFDVYYESRKRELKTRPIYECRCDERLKTKDEKSTCLTYTGLLGGLEHLKMKTRLINEMFASVMGEYVFLKW